MITLPVQILDDKAIIPKRAYEGDAGYDLHSVVDITLKPFERALIGTGIAIEIPRGYAGFVLPRSGLAIKQGLSLVNAPGLIDSNFRGELKVIAVNLDPNKAIDVKVGDRIAQLVIMDVEDVDFRQVSALESSERGSGGFGSSGITAY
jgi:dUTP pyrophosphatase